MAICSREDRGVGHQKNLHSSLTSFCVALPGIQIRNLGKLIKNKTEAEILLNFFHGDVPYTAESQKVKKQSRSNLS